MKFIWILNEQDNTKVLSLNGGKYQYEDINEVPEEYLDWIVENYLKTHDLEKLFTAYNAIVVKIKRIRKDLDLELEKCQIPTKIIKQPTNDELVRKLFRKRPVKNNNQKNST